MATLGARTLLLLALAGRCGAQSSTCTLCDQPGPACTLCLAPVPSTLCYSPLANAVLPPCGVVAKGSGERCRATMAAECDTDQALNNCGIFSVYQEVPCNSLQQPSTPPSLVPPRLSPAAPSMPPPSTPPSPPPKCGEKAEEEEIEPAQIGNLEGPDASLVLAIFPFFIIHGALWLAYILLFPRFKKNFNCNPLRRNFGPEPPTTAFHFVPLVLSISDDDLERHVGLDGFALLLFIRTMIKSIFGFAFIAFAVLVPSYAVAYHEGDVHHPGALAKITLANVPSESHWALVLSTIALYAFTIWILYCMRQSWMDLVARRHRYLSSPTSGPAARSILVTNPAVFVADPANLLGARRTTIAKAPEPEVKQEPASVQSSSWFSFGSSPAQTPVAEPSSLATSKPSQHGSISRTDAISTWEKLFPGHVLGVTMLRNTGNLGKLQEKKKKLRNVVDHLATKPADDKAGWLSSLSDSLLARQLHWGRAAGERLTEAREMLRGVELLLADENDALSHDDQQAFNYFVLFKANRECNLAKTAITGAVGAKVVLAAPDPVDVNYEALEPGAVKKAALKRQAALLLYVALLILYFAPIAFLSFLISISNLEFIGDLVPAAKAFIDSLLPTLGLTIFLSILPSICKVLANILSPPRKSEVEIYAFKMLFQINLTWNFIGITLASGLFVLFDQIECLAKDPTGVLTDLGSTLASQGVFFMSFLAVQALLVIPLKELLLLTPITKELALKTVGLMKPTEIPPEPFVWFKAWDKVMYGTAIGLCYATVSPISILFSLFHLGQMYVLYARNMMLAYTNDGANNGFFWPVAASRVCVIIGIAQLLVVAVQAVNGSWVVFATLPAFALPYLFHRHATAVYEPQLSILPLTVSIQSDQQIQDSQTTDKAFVDEFLAAYSQPEFKVAQPITEEKI